MLQNSWKEIFICFHHPEINKERRNNQLSNKEEKEAGSGSAVRHKYGMYKNVVLSDEEIQKLKTEFPSDYESRIERLSEYMTPSGKHYKSHLATIRSWARRDAKKKKVMAYSHENYQYEEGESLRIHHYLVFWIAFRNSKCQVQGSILAKMD